MKYPVVYLIKYKTSDYEYHHLVRGSFKYYESAMRKVEELRADQMVTKIVVMKRVEGRGKRVYCWEEGFETVYLNNGNHN